MTKPKLAVGMTVWVVYNSRIIDGVERTIAKLGRKWAYITHRERFDIDTWRIDGGEYCSPGSVYASEQEYQYHKALSLEWELLQKAFLKSSYRGIPDGMTLEKIQQIKMLLGMAE